MDANTQNQHQVPPDAAEGGVQAQRLSAWMDGELHRQEADLVIRGMARDDGGELQLAWASYHLIGDSLRGQLPAIGGARPIDFLSAFHRRLAEDGEGAGTTPTVAAVVPTPQGIGRPDAANEAVFRWKMVAGLASLAAVMGVAWGVLGTLPGATDASVRLVEAAPRTAPSQAGAGDAVQASATVVVETPQGTIIRDARLQQLLAEHRQNGMSALQMPAGFLRNATHDGARSR